MNPEAILALISDLTTQVHALSAENSRLTKQLEETRAARNAENK